MATKKIKEQKTGTDLVTTHWNANSRLAVVTEAVDVNFYDHHFDPELVTIALNHLPMREGNEKTKDIFLAVLSSIAEYEYTSTHNNRRIDAYHLESLGNGAINAVQYFKEVLDPNDTKHNLELSKKDKNKIKGLMMRLKVFYFDVKHATGFDMIRLASDSDISTAYSNLNNH